MGKRTVHGSGKHRYVDFSTRPVYRVRFKPFAHELWKKIFDDCGCDSLADHQFFAKRQHVEFDVYPWDEHPNAGTDFFAVDDDDRVLPFSMFESFSPEIVIAARETK